VLGYFWEGQAPLRVLTFSWKLLLDRISTKANLVICNILPLEDLGNCVLCDREGENSKNLFLCLCFDM